MRDHPLSMRQLIETVAGTMLYRATDSRYHGPPCGWTWWTPDRAWARHYGSHIITRPAAGLRLLRLPLDALDARAVLERHGIDTTAITWGYQDEPEWEIQQVLAHRHDGPKLAAAVRQAGYDGVRHPDHIYEIGTGVAVALAQ